MFDFVKNIGLPEIIIIGVLLLVFFGGAKVKELSRGLGESAKEVKKIKNDDVQIEFSDPNAPALFLDSKDTDFFWKL